MSFKTLTNNDFPGDLLMIDIPPKKLYLWGDVPSEDMVLLTIVGTRNPSNYGINACANIIKGLSGYNIGIISGLARGIDTAAHKASLANDIKTYAVLGGGFGKSVLYPKENLPLANEIVEAGGGILSEYPEDSSPLPHQFPLRNRIMTGMSSAILVVEGTLKSGTSVTANLALRYNKDVFAIPGPIDSPLSVGPNKLIQDGAIPVHSSDDIIFALNLSLPNSQEEI